MEYKVPFVNYSLQYKNLEKEIDAAIKKVLSEGQLILREDVERFEKKLAEFLGVKYVVSLNSGTDALIFALKSAGIGPGDEVITVSHTFFATIEAIIHNGAKPVFVEVREDFLIDPNQIEERITKKTKAIIVVHYNGRMCEMDKIMEIANKHNLFVIEDSAQSLGATYNNKKAGSFGTAGCFSFYPAKILGTAGDGGAVCTNDEQIAEKARLLRGHGIKGKTEIVLYGFTSRLDNLQAAILNVKLPYLGDWIAKRREIAKRYQAGLSDLKEVKTPPHPEEIPNFDVYQNYVLKAKKRNELYNYLKKQGVETLIKDPVANHKHPGLGLEHFSLPYTEQLADEVISLPMYPELTNEQVDYVIKTVKEFYS
ncbi:MAG: DegT/DnrJ/EryC1/StrS family aminotransferase [Candidatus Staskawiczbacteria bacterium]|nr:DegT/DnrJ/EryC1/StrS family aminotransferase [Candidatus Staskawiczbacteria bacterium]